MPGEPIRAEEQVLHCPPPPASGIFLGPSPHAPVPVGAAVLSRGEASPASRAWPAWVSEALPSSHRPGFPAL